MQEKEKERESVRAHIRAQESERARAREREGRAERRIRNIYLNACMWMSIFTYLTNNSSNCQWNVSMLWGGYD